jgi:uncharacterized protein
MEPAAGSATRVAVSARRFLDLAREGRNEWWRYLSAIVLIIAGGQVLGAVPYLFLARSGRFSDLLDFIALNLGVLVELAVLAVVVRGLHRRTLLSLVTPRATFDWRRALQGFALWFALVATASLFESWLYPGRYRLTFDAQAFFQFAVAALLLTPLQTATEELLFRGYLMQALGLLLRRPLALAVVSSALFMLPHLGNPEVARSPVLIPLEYLTIGFVLALVTLRDGRLELAMGLHAANNLFNALIANYEGSVLPTSPIFTSELDPLYSFCALVGASIVFCSVLFRPGRRRAKNI